MLTAAGAWLGFGFKCEGRITKENKKREKISESKSDTELKEIREKKWYYWSRILFSLIGSCVIFSLITNKMMEVFWVYFVVAAVIFVLIGLVTLYIFQFFTNPSEERSNKILLDNIEIYKRKEGKEKVTGKYGRMRYCMQNGKMEIDAVNLIYPGHEREVNELFGSYTSVLCQTRTHI